LEKLTLLTDNPIEPIWQIIEQCWLDSGARSDYIQVMRRVLFPGGGIKPNLDHMRWALLPGTCCQAAGGNPRWADELAAAWFLFYCAADIMDSAEDQDPLDPGWLQSGYPFALSAASGIYFSASRCLSRLYLRKETQTKGGEINDLFSKSFMRMCAGQHLDLTTPRPNLAQFWEIAAGKSGAFFSLACHSGALLATDDPETIDHYHNLGMHLGLLIQVLDDLKEFQNSPDNLLAPAANTRRSLPVVYAMEYIQLEQRQQLETCLQAGADNPAAAEEARRIIENAGAVLYLLTEIDHHRSNILNHLSQAKAFPPAGQVLEDLVQNLVG
jgi:geranylgeranyl pyrophosphate synthase